MVSKRVELIVFSGCPRADAARRNLREALHRAEMSLQFTEWDSLAERTPPERRGFGSPSILIDGVPLGGSVTGSGAACTIGGAPSVDVILAALRAPRP
jgi:hypothetical protein